MNRKRKRKHIGKVDQPYLHPETMTILIPQEK